MAILASDQDLLNHAELAISSLSAIHDHTGDEQTPTEFKIFYAPLGSQEELSGALALVAKEDPHGGESLISELESIGSQGDNSADKWIYERCNMTWTELLVAMA